MPAGSKILPLRSNIPAISEYVYAVVDETFAVRAKAAKKSVIVGGDNYGQGSSREHAALAPMYLGVKAVLAKSYARIHKANLINFGILPLTFENNDDYEIMEQGDKLELKEVRKSLEAGEPIRVRNITKRQTVIGVYNLTERERTILLAGGKLNWVKAKREAEEAAAAEAATPKGKAKSKKKAAAKKPKAPKSSTKATATKAKAREKAKKKAAAGKK